MQRHQLIRPRKPTSSFIEHPSTTASSSWYKLAKVCHNSSTPQLIQQGANCSADDLSCSCSHHAIAGCPTRLPRHSCSAIFPLPLPRRATVKPPVQYQVQVLRRCVLDYDGYVLRCPLWNLRLAVSHPLSAAVMVMTMDLLTNSLVWQTYKPR